MIDGINGVIFHEATRQYMSDNLAGKATARVITNNSLEECYPYCIVLEPDLYKEAYAWCEKNLPKKDGVHWSERRWFTSGAWDSKKYYYHFYFKEIEDAVLFSLRWS